MLSVAVLVELIRGDTSGGHVKCWERFAESAARLPAPAPALDLTVYFLGTREHVEALSPRVRLVMLRPLLGSGFLTSARGAEDVTDLAPYHPRLAALLPRHDVWHLTHGFAYATTAVRLARRTARTGGPAPRLVASVHTDVPALAAVYARYLAARRLPRAGPPLARGAEHWLRRRRDRLLANCERVLVPTPAGCAELTPVLGADRVGLLRRGVDHTRFRPDPTARARLIRAYGLPADRPLILFAGRLDASKGLPLLAERAPAARPRAAGTPGAGGRGRGGRTRTPLPRTRRHPARPAPAGPPGARLRRLRPVRLPLPHGDLRQRRRRGHGRRPRRPPPRGCPHHRVADRPRRGRHRRTPGHPRRLGHALAALLDDPPRLTAVRHRAAATAREAHPSWDRVLAEDLLPVWLPERPSRDDVP
ncbi:hypothetical protein SGLAM104S_01905 [Streptomyces glaucescens]